MDVEGIAAQNGFKVVAWGKPFGKKTVAPAKDKVPQKVAPKLVGKKTAAPLPKVPAKKPVEKEAKPKATPYGNSANGKAGGVMKLLIAWAKNDRDPETRKVMEQILIATKKIVWEHLSDKKRKELEKL